MSSHRHAPPLPAFLRPSGDSSSTSLRHPSGDADALRVASPSELCSARQTTLAGPYRLLGRSRTLRAVSPPRRFCQLALTRVPEGFCTESQPSRLTAPFSGSVSRPCSPGRSSPPWCSPNLPGSAFTALHPLMAFASSPGTSPRGRPSASSRKPVGVSRSREHRPPWRFGPSSPLLPRRPRLAPNLFSHHRDQSGTSPMVRTPQGCGDATWPSKDSHHRSLAALAGDASREVHLTFDVLGAAVAGRWVTRSLLGVWRPRGLPVCTGTPTAVKRSEPPSVAFGSPSETDSGLVESGGCPQRSDTSPGVFARSALSEHRVGLEAPPSHRRSAIPSRSFPDPQGFNPR